MNIMDAVVACPKCEGQEIEKGVTTNDAGRCVVCGYDGPACSFFDSEWVKNGGYNFVQLRGLFEQAITAAD